MLLDDVASVPREKIPALVAALMMRLLELELEPAPAPEAAADQPDRMLTTEETAKILRRSTKWVYRNVKLKRLPFAKKMSERSWVFSENGLQKWLARQKA
jgi:predicted DNA-binding transcriptional regulator AlpA